MNKNLPSLLFLSFLIFPSLVVFSASSVSVYNISADKNPSYGVFFDGKIYAVMQGASEIQVIQGNSTVSTITLPNNVSGVPFRITAGGGYLYVVYQKGPLLQLSSSGNLIKEYSIPKVGKYPAICYADGYVIVTSSYGDTISLIRNGTMDELKVMAGPQALAYDNYTNVIYVGAYKSNLIYGVSLSSLSVVSNFTINDTTVDAMAFVPPDVLAIATYEQQVEFVNLSNDRVIGVTNFPTGGINGYSQLIYDPADNYVILSLAHNNDQVAVMNESGTLKYLITVGDSPNGVVYNPSNKYVYVMDYSSNQISYFLSPGFTQKSVGNYVNFDLIYAVAGVIVVLLLIGVVVLVLRKRK